MKLPLLVLAGVLLALVAVAPTASAHGSCTWTFGPSPAGGVVEVVYRFTTQTVASSTCGVAYPIADGACHFLVGNTCPI
jgi:hypothetical protein